MNYKWDFGDGNITSTIEKIITHSYTLEGDYDVNLTITDNSSTTNSTTKFVQVVATGITIDLYTGWNLISLPLMPEETSIAFVLSPIMGDYSIIWAYNASDTADYWKKYDPSAPFGNDLAHMEAGKGYRIMMTSDNALNISGTVPESTDINLKNGWNLIGYNSLESQPITDALSSITGNYSIVWAYDASDTDHWKKYDPSAPFGNDLAHMEAGKGYWIMMTTDDILEI
ncbi:MAG: PKD domain-containing protein [Methanosarcinales archaeon]|nr:PKD domain-containing protein [Methanosarcinales archaeon]